MQVFFEGQAIKTNSEIDYDYLEVKYNTVSTFAKKEYILVPVTYAKYNNDINLQNRKCLCSDINTGAMEGLSLNSDDDILISKQLRDEMLANYENTCISEANICKYSSNDVNCNIGGSSINNKIQNNLIKTTDKINTCTCLVKNNRYLYDKNDISCLLINYFKIDKCSKKGGIMDLTEFHDFLIRENSIVHCESFIIKKPFSIEENAFDNYKTLDIKINYPEIISSIKLVVDTGYVYNEDNKYKIFGNPNSYTIIAKNINYTFPSMVNL